MAKKKAVKPVQKAKKKAAKAAKERKKKVAKPAKEAKKKALKPAKETQEDKKEKDASRETALRNIERDLILGSGTPLTSRRAESLPELTPEEEREIAIASKQIFDEKGPDSFKDNKPAQALFIYTLRHVTRLAYKYRGYGIPEEDLIQEGMIGLMEAIKRYDPDKKGKSNKTKDGKLKPRENARLATYASFWIIARMNDHVLKHFSIYGKIATTEAQRRLFFKLRSETADLGRRLDIEEADKIAAKYDVKLADVLEMEKRFLPKITYEKPDSGDNDEFDASPSMTLTAGDDENPEILAIRASVKSKNGKVLLEAYRRLDQREAKVFKARHLTEEGEKITLKELAGELGVSIERVRQIADEAFRKVQDYVLEHSDPEDFDG